MKEKHYVMHVLSHCHWDREWYQDFQGFRQRLVYQIDMLMDLLEKRPEYRYFHLDGQTICIRDYLQIRPEVRERLAGHIKSGRILIGPWYVMPDELLLSGESLVMNLIIGHRICREFGIDPMPAGYVTDIFGHCSQFPQVLHGFGIDTVVLHRGTTNADDMSELLWEGADGSKVLVIKAYPYTGYNDFLNHRNLSDEELLEYEKKKIAMARTSILFALEGNDHTQAFWDSPEKIEHINSVFKDIKCIHSALPEYINELKQELGDHTKCGLKTYFGELRCTKKKGLYAELMNGTGSSRVTLKQSNDQLEYLLPRYAEPLHAWSVLLGGDSQKAFLNLAWEYLIANHPHDSICGCSIDQVHRDMIYRFDQARLLAENSIGESIQVISDKLNTASLGESEAVVTVYNLANTATEPVTQFCFEIPSNCVEEKEKDGLHPILVDNYGTQIYSEIESIDREALLTAAMKKVRDGSPGYYQRLNGGSLHHRYHINAVTSIPAMGYASYAVKFAPKKKDESIALPVKVKSVIVDRENRFIENEYIRLIVRNDALIDVYDKQAGIWYRNLHDLEDCGDFGDGWNHSYPKVDTVIRASEPGAKSAIRIHFRQTGALSASAKIEYNFKVPEDRSSNGEARSRSVSSVRICINIKIRSGSPRIDFETVINNTAKCHRVRALFSSGRNTKTWSADSAFDVVERNIKLPDTTGWEEPAREETPIKNFAAVSDRDGGFAIITKGLCEACVQDNPERILALTLFRSFKQRMGEGWTNDSLLLGEMKLNYSLLLLNHNQDILQREIERYKISPISITSSAHSGDLSSTGILMEIPENAIVSTIKVSKDGKSIILRLYNPEAQLIAGRVGLFYPIKHVWKCDLLEKDKAELSVTSDGDVDVELKPKEIITLRLT